MYTNPNWMNSQNIIESPRTGQITCLGDADQLALVRVGLAAVADQVDHHQQPAQMLRVLRLKRWKKLTQNPKQTTWSALFKAPLR